MPTSKGKGKGKGMGRGREGKRAGVREGGDGVREGDPQSLFYKSDTGSRTFLPSLTF